MIERSPATILDGPDDADESAMVVSTAAAIVSPVVPHDVPAAPPVEEVTSSPATSKKNKKAAKKLTIQTGAAEREQLLQAVNSSVTAAEIQVPEEGHVDAPSEEEAVMEEHLQATADTPFATPSRKKDKKSAKSASKSLLKTQATGGLGFDVSASAERRVSFSHPLSMVKIISPLSTGGKHSTAGTPVNSAKKSKKRLWAEEEA